MSRLAIQSGFDAYGSSRIPRPFGPVDSTHSRPFGHVNNTRSRHFVMMQNGHSGGRPSKLQQMQSDYQNKLLKEKESKLIEMYELNQQRALEKVGGRNKGMVRDFFNERRTNSLSGSPKSNLSPTMEHMYKRKQVEHKQQIVPPKQQNGQSRQSFGFTGTHYTSQGPNQNIPQPTTYKSSAGRDRSKPLAPIQRPPFPSKPQIVRPRTQKDNLRDKENLVNKEMWPKSAPTGNYGMDNDSASDDSPLPNAKQLEALQQKRKLLQSQRSNKSIISVQSSKPSDFQKWQNEQDSAREKRLQRHRAKNGPQHATDDEGYEDDDDDLSKEDMKKKQAELMAQIEAQQRELEKIRKERAREEVEEKKEMERRRKVEEERKRKQAEDEKRKRKLEEEERLRREHEEERSRKMQAERKRLRQNSEKSRQEYMESDMEEDSGYEQFVRKDPTPPPQPKPATTASRRHPVPAKTKTTQKQPPPPAAGGAHTALYEDAFRMEDAHGEVGRLRPCNNCGRKFAEDRIQKHEAACKNATKKRKVMDPTKLRTRGTEMEQYTNTRHKQPEPKQKKNNWRSKHENFIQAIRYARKMKQVEDEGGNLADLPPPPVTENPDYVQCQYCSRKFNAQAAERHIPHCKNTRNRPAPPKRR